MKRETEPCRGVLIFPRSASRYAAERSAAKVASCSGQTITYRVLGEIIPYQIGGQRTMLETGGQTLVMTVDAAKRDFSNQHAKFSKSK